MGKPILKWSSTEKMQYVRSWLRIVSYGGFFFQLFQPSGNGTTWSRYCTRVEINPWTGPESSRKLRLPDFKTIGT